MSANQALETRRASTKDVPLEQRQAFWEDYNASALVGLSCSSYAQSGLTATQENLCLEGLRMARIHGNEHVVERTLPMIRALPSESIFVGLVQGGQPFFYQGSECQLLRQGELLIYRNDQPYLFGFSGPMSLLVFDVPQRHFFEHCLRDLKGVMKIGCERPVQRLLTQYLGQRAGGFLDVPNSEGVEYFQQEFYELLTSIVSDQRGKFSASGLSAAYTLAAKQYITQHLEDRSLTCDQVAAATGISSRHLTRLFAQEGMAPSRYLLEKRLERARQLLVSSLGHRLSIAEIAYSTGFSSQAHFARAFKCRFEMTPSESRERCVLPNPALPVTA